MSTIELHAATSLRMLEPLLAALGGGAGDPLPLGGLPTPVFQLPEIATVLCATAVMAPDLYRRTVLATAEGLDIDVLLVRHGLHPETLDLVEYDLVLPRVPTTHRLWSRCLYRGVDGALWLVPGEPGAAASGHVQVTAAGLRWTADAPYADLHQRADGVARAARATVLSLRHRRRQ